MSFFDKYYLNKYYEIMRKIDSLNERNGQGYSTFKEYVLSNEVMIGYFNKLKKLEKKYNRLKVDDDNTFYNHIFDQLNGIYHECVEAIIKDDKSKFQYNNFNELEQDILESFGHGCDTQLKIIYDDFQNRNKSKYEGESNDVCQLKTILKNEEKKDFFSLEINNWIEKTNIKYQLEYNCYDLNCCPICGVVLEKKVRTSKKCPECKQKLFIKTNKISKRKLLMGPEKYIQYNRDIEELDEILFMNRQIELLKKAYPSYMNKLYEMRKEKYLSISPRDYTWIFENWLMNELDEEGFKILNKAQNEKFEDRISDGDKAYSLFKSGISVYHKMAEVAKYKGKIDIYFDILMGILYRSVIVANLPYTYWDDRTFSEEGFESDLTLYMYPVAELYYLNNMKINDLKKEFMNRRSPYILKLVSREKAWDLIQEYFINYLKRWDYREGKYETLCIDTENEELIINNVKMKDEKYDDGFFFCRLHFDSYTTQNYFLKYKDYIFRELVFEFYNRNNEVVYEQTIRHNCFSNQEYNDHSVELIFADHIDNILSVKLKTIILKKELTKYEIKDDEKL